MYDVKKKYKYMIYIYIRDFKIRDLCSIDEALKIIG
jgi:hypothetical protein